MGTYQSIMVRIEPKKLTVGLANADLSLNKLALEAEVSLTTLKNALCGKKTHPYIAGRIARALGVPVTEILCDE